MTRYSWTQPSCDRCRQNRNPGRAPIRMTPDNLEAETCCFCSQVTFSGIYVRTDPALTPYPTIRKDD